MPNMVQPTFDVLTVSKRNGWETMAIKQITSQTVKPNHWYIVHERPVYQSKPSHKGWSVFQQVRAPEPVRASNLNASLNTGLKLINSDYVIFYQDFIELQSDCFEKLLALVDKQTFVTSCTPNYDGSNDNRYTGLNKPRDCAPWEWEANVSIAPMAVIRELGGFDEEYDNGWSWDNCNIAERAAMIGCKFIIDESNRPKLLDHEQTSKLEFEPNAEFHEETMRAIRDGRKPLRLNYL